MNEFPFILYLSMQLIGIIPIAESQRKSPSHIYNSVLSIVRPSTQIFIFFIICMTRSSVIPLKTNLQSEC